MRHVYLSAIDEIVSAEQVTPPSLAGLLGALCPCCGAPVMALDNNGRRCSQRSKPHAFSHGEASCEQLDGVFTPDALAQLEAESWGRKLPALRRLMNDQLEAKLEDSAWREFRKTSGVVGMSKLLADELLAGTWMNNVDEIVEVIAETRNLSRFDHELDYLAMYRILLTKRLVQELRQSFDEQERLLIAELAVQWMYGVEAGTISVREAGNTAVHPPRWRQSLSEVVTALRIGNVGHVLQLRSTPGYNPSKLFAALGETAIAFIFNLPVLEVLVSKAKQVNATEQFIKSVESLSEPAAEQFAPA